VAGPWTFDDALAKEVVAAAGTSLDASVDEIGLALQQWVPSGSTAKREAMQAGDLPPGLEPAPVAEAILEGSAHAWTCWPASTIAVAVFRAAGHDADVVAQLRTDPGSPPVDVHAAVVVDGHLHVDLCLGPGLGVEVPEGERSGPAAVARLVPYDGGGPGGFAHHLRGPSLDLSYVSTNRVVDRRALHALLELSTTHTGVGVDRRFWKLGLPDGLVAVTEREGRPRRKRWRRDGDGWLLEEEVEGAWDDLVAGALDLARARRTAAP
jgi:hypothetical protein